MLLFHLAAPIFLVFEIWQLVLSERYLGIKQIARGADPRALGLGEITAFCWSVSIIAYWLWMLVLLVLPFGRLHAVGLIVLTVAGFSLRRGAPLKWILVILTFEGALRIAILINLAAHVWRQL